MARKIVCPVCDSERFRKVVVRLPSGKDRVTEFEACWRCATVFHRPEEPARESVSNITDYASHVPTDVSSSIAKTFPDPNTATAEMQSAHYKHATFGRLVLIYKRQAMRGTEETGMRWYLTEARRFTE